MIKLENQFARKKVFFAAFLIIFGVVTRYLLRDLPNIETITVVSLLAGALLGGVWTIVVGLIVVAATDIAIGNTLILIYAWSAWAVMGFFGFLGRRNQKVWKKTLLLTGGGILGNIFFYLWTNFGVWHIGGLYPRTWDGLLASYLMGLPFLKLQLLSTLLFVPTISPLAIMLWNILPLKIYSLNNKTLPSPLRARQPNRHVSLKE